MLKTKTLIGGITNSLLPGLRLLVQLSLNTALPRLALVMSVHLPLLLLPVPREARDRAAKRALQPAASAILQVLELALGLLALPALVLHAAVVDHLLVAEQVSRRLFEAAHGLVVLAVLAVLVVLRDAAAADGERADPAGVVGGLVLGVGLGLGLLSFDLDWVSYVEVGEWREARGALTCRGVGLPCRWCCR